MKDNGNPIRKSRRSLTVAVIIFFALAILYVCSSSILNGLLGVREPISFMVKWAQVSFTDTDYVKIKDDPPTYLATKHFDERNLIGWMESQGYTYCAELRMTPSYPFVSNENGAVYEIDYSSGAYFPRFVIIKKEVPMDDLMDK